jgi:hypothetical protein
MKARHRRTVFWVVFSILTTIVMAAVIVPPLISLNGLKPRFERAILLQTEIPAKIRGKVNISLLGRVNVVAHKVSMPGGQIDSVIFAVPLSKIFDINSAPLTGKIMLSGARLIARSLIAPKLANKIEISDSEVNFMGKNYKIINGVLHNGNFTGTIRTKLHKYAVETNGADFWVANKNEGVSVRGRLNPNGGANASLSMNTDDFNSWFDILEPGFNKHVSLKMNIDWDGGNGFKFSDIIGNVTGGGGFTGNISLPAEGMREIKFASNSISRDLSFLIMRRSLLKNAQIELDLSGSLKFAGESYKRIKLSAIEADDRIKISVLEFESDRASGALSGEIAADGAHGMDLRFKRGEADIYCLFNGAPNAWRCDEYEYSDASISAFGTLVAGKNSFSATLKSKSPMPEKFDFAKALNFLGANGTVLFEFSDAGGKIEIKNKKQNIIYSFVKNKTLNWPHAGDFGFLPEPMRAQPGLMTWSDEGFSFLPENEKWKLTALGDFFYLSGTSALELINSFEPSLELPFINDFPYEISGNYSKPYITDLELHIAGHIFRGSANGTNITLKTEVLNLDQFSNDKYFDSYDEMQFLSGEPILAPFKLGRARLSLSAFAIILGGEKYDNFAYSLRDGIQSFSITDDARGSLLISLKKSLSNYDIMIKLNRFVFRGALPDMLSPLNISDSVATGQARLTTGGKIAYDFWRGMKGSLDISFDGGVLNGIGTDAFYASAADITRLNAEDAIAHAVSGGRTNIKSLRISGEYENGKFRTTRKFQLSARHSEMFGDLQLEGGKMTAQIDILLRGASIEPKPVSLAILPSGERSYSLSEIMRVLDPGYLADFIRTHSQF